MSTLALPLGRAQAICVFLVLITAACSGVASMSSANGAGLGADASPESGRGEHPRYAADGSLLRPVGWESWVLAGTSIGLTYNELAAAPVAGRPPGNFLNVYVQPWAYHSFMDTGIFPEGTMFILASSRPVEKADPARGGFYQGEISLLEVHLKNASVHETGWGFYGFDGAEETGKLQPPDARCYSCHRDEAAYDHVFVQFYPAMRSMLSSKGLLPQESGATND